MVRDNGTYRFNSAKSDIKRVRLKVCREWSKHLKRYLNCKVKKEAIGHILRKFSICLKSSPIRFRFNIRLDMIKFIKQTRSIRLLRAEKALCLSLSCFKFKLMSLNKITILQRGLIISNGLNISSYN
jgi:hypothetical protein